MFDNLTAAVDLFIDAAKSDAIPAALDEFAKIATEAAEAIRKIQAELPDVKDAGLRATAPSASAKLDDCAHKLSECERECQSQKFATAAAPGEAKAFSPMQVIALVRLAAQLIQVVKAALNK